MVSNRFDEVSEEGQRGDHRVYIRQMRATTTKAGAILAGRSMTEMAIAACRTPLRQVLGENKARPGNVQGPCALTVGPKGDYPVDTLPVVNVCPDCEGSTDATGRVRECHEKGVNSRAAGLLFHCVSAQQRNRQPSREVLVVLVDPAQESRMEKEGQKKTMEEKMAFRGRL